MAYLWIGLGSAIGGMARYWCGGIVSRFFGETFPWGTLTVNLIGSSFLVFFATLTAYDGRLLVSPTTRQFVMVGLCGGFTTFSTFSLETLSLVRDREWLLAASNMAASVVLCLVGAWLGFVLANLMNER